MKKVIRIVAVCVFMCFLIVNTYDYNLVNEGNIPLSEGKYIVDRQVRTRLACSSIAEDQNGMESGFAGPGRRMGMEMFEREVSPEKTGREASRVALARLGASFCPAGQMTVAIENGFGGAIFHEACGHSLEATAVATGTSQIFR